MWEKQKSPLGRGPESLFALCIELGTREINKKTLEIRQIKSNELKESKTHCNWGIGEYEREVPIKTTTVSNPT